MDDLLARMLSDTAFRLAVVSLAVNGFAPTIARQYLQRSLTSRDQLRAWLSEVMDSGSIGDQLNEEKEELQKSGRTSDPRSWKQKVRRNEDRQRTYALMDYFAQVVATTVAVFLLLGQVWVLDLNRGQGQSIWSWILLFAVVIVLWFFIVRVPKPELSRFLPKNQSRTTRKFLLSLESLFGPPPPSTALRWVRYLATVLTLFVPVVDLIISTPGSSGT